MELTTPFVSRRARGISTRGIPRRARVRLEPKWLRIDAEGHVEAHGDVARAGDEVGGDLHSQGCVELRLRLVLGDAGALNSGP